MRKRKLLLLILMLSLVLVACGKDKGENGEVEAFKLPVDKQAAVQLIEPIEGEALIDYEEEGYSSYTRPEYEKIVSGERFAHLQGDSEGYYINVLKMSYGKNLLFQPIKKMKVENEKALAEKEVDSSIEGGNFLDEDIKKAMEDSLIGSLVKNPSKPTVLVFSRSNCPYCVELMEELKDKYSENDFNLVYAQGHVSTADDIIEDFKMYYEEAKELDSDFILGKCGFNTDSLMDDLGVWYYPTLVYLDNQGFIKNVSQGMVYEDILRVVNLTFPVDKSEN